jgi:predicted  nucleic acid-binding Zn-ribbon protein
MAKTVQNVAEKLKQLYRLQTIDSKIDEIQILKGELPIEVSDLEDEIAGLDKRVKRLEETIAEMDHEIANHNGNIKEAEMLIGRYEKQLDDVKNNREFEALTKEIELQNLEIQLSQKKIGDVNRVKEVKQATLKEAQERMALKQGNLDIKKVELQKILEKTTNEEGDLQKKSADAKTNIEARLLKAYVRVRERYRNGLAVVTVERDACGGCFNRIPPQLQIEIGHYKNIVACEHCGRVLVDDDIANEFRTEPVVA